jgi:hypothetical protein
MAVNNKAIVEKVNAAFAAGSTEGFLACCAEDVAWTMVGDTTVQGKDAIRQWMASMGPMEPICIKLCRLLHPHCLPRCTTRAGRLPSGEQLLTGFALPFLFAQ